MLSGIYKIENIATGDFYIGSSQDIFKRFHEHLIRLSENKHANPHLQSAWNKYGDLYFGLKILLFCKVESLLYYEQILIDKLSPKYNIAIIAGSPMKGRRHSEATKEKQRLFHNQRTSYPEFEASWKNPFYKGKHLPENVKEKIRQANIGKVRSKEDREKISKGQMGIVHWYRILLGELTSPEGTIFKNIENLAKFSRENNINKRRMSEFYLGKRTKWKGWNYVAIG